MSDKQSNPGTKKGKGKKILIAVAVILILLIVIGATSGNGENGAQQKASSTNSESPSQNVATKDGAEVETEVKNILEKLNNYKYARAFDEIDSALRAASEKPGDTDLAYKAVEAIGKYVSEYDAEYPEAELKYGPIGSLEYKNMQNNPYWKDNNPNFLSQERIEWYLENEWHLAWDFVQPALFDYERPASINFVENKNPLENLAVNGYVVNDEPLIYFGGPVKTTVRLGDGTQYTPFTFISSEEGGVVRADLDLYRVTDYNVDPNKGFDNEAAAAAYQDTDLYKNPVLQCIFTRDEIDLINAKLEELVKGNGEAEHFMVGDKAVSLSGYGNMQIISIDAVECPYLKDMEAIDIYSGLNPFDNGHVDDVLSLPWNTYTYD